MTSYYKTLGITVAAVALVSAPVLAADNVYGTFPVTEKSYKGSKKNSVAYTGQIARQVLHDSLKKLAGKGNGKPNAKLKAEMMSYYAGKGKGRSIVAPKSKGTFTIKQTAVDQISKKKNLSGKTYKGAISGMPNNMTGPELVKFWIDKASSAKKGVDAANGYNYPQLISKFIMGAVFYNQAVDNYLDEKLGAKNKPNNKPYKKGAAYTGKEHSWDEAFGYFGTPAHALTLSPDQLYGIAKRKAKAKSYADKNGDGKVDLYKEMVFGPAYYAAGYDRSGKTSYSKNIVTAFLDGRKLITSANGAALTDGQRAKLRAYAKVIEKNWQQTLAESVFKYAGSVFKDLKKIRANHAAKKSNDKALKKYIKHWGELKGFSLALQTGKSNLGETAARLNRLIGYGPVMMNASQVTDIDSKGNYVKGEASGLGEYMAHMLKAQKLMVDKFGVKARNNDQMANMSEMLKKLGSGSAAEND
ncbi:MAG: DUF4856 domain-containing protein [Rhodospirillaceae bacterium]|nr:DUF4856 domain-containing protein [Rhodospirillaceae bacterium]|tara:strand:+ start:701 stop:2113 length:1413 start_codon:yes stop_codon:yes gene_type:complete